MRRRGFLCGLASTVAAWPRTVFAQPSARVPRIGVLLSQVESDPEQLARREGLREGLERLGWSDGRNVRIDYRYAGGQDRFAPLAKEMVAQQCDVIFVQSTGFVAAVAQETRTIPVVFANVSDPIGSGFVKSLSRPGGNLTGLMLFEAGIASKWLGMLKEISPRLRRAALMADPRTTPFDYFFRLAEAAAPSLATELTASRVGSSAEIEHAIESIARVPDSGVFIAPSSTMLRNRRLIIELAARHRVPVVYPERIYAVDGGLMSYGIADPVEPFRQAASYVDRILRGEKPADLPVQGPTKYSTVLNLRTAKALGLTVPSGLLVAADEVIE
jgi:putative tryptophan/tyrosine transport system substrate-binding protein